MKQREGAMSLKCKANVDLFIQHRNFINNMNLTAKSLNGQQKLWKCRNTIDTDITQHQRYRNCPKSTVNYHEKAAMKIEYHAMRCKVKAHCESEMKLTYLREPLITTSSFAKMAYVDDSRWNTGNHHAQQKSRKNK